VDFGLATALSGWIAGALLDRSATNHRIQPAGGSDDPKVQAQWLPLPTHLTMTRRYGSCPSRAGQRLERVLARLLKH
jgi:hypothetical protein